MALSGKQKNFKKSYEREVALMTKRYEELNAQALTVVRQATEEENKYYMEILDKMKGRK